MGVVELRITLKAARANAQLTQQEAAEKIGVTVDTIGNWERAKSFPNALQIRRIEEVYGVPYDGLIFSPKNTL
jgi:transcriptional regulator with XRE-family HTH domain